MSRPVTQDVWFLRILNGIMGALFAFGAVVQYNDPDPLRWVLVYAAASFICVWTALRGRAPARAALGIGFIALVWSVMWFRGDSLDMYLHMFDSWEMKTVPAEEARETSGLWIIAGWMGFLAIHAWFRTRGRHDAR